MVLIVSPVFKIVTCNDKKHSENWSFLHFLMWIFRAVLILFFIKIIWNIEEKSRKQNIQVG